MKNRTSIMLLALAISGNSAWAGNEPTIQDAHDFINNVISKQTTALGYDDKGYKYGSYLTYEGANCESSFTWSYTTYRGIKSGSTRVIWEDITEVVYGTSSIKVTLSGRVISNGNPVAEAMYVFPDATIANRTAKAFTLLMKSCAKKSKFD